MSVSAVGLGLAIDQLALALVQSILGGVLLLQGVDPDAPGAEAVAPAGSSGELLAFVVLGASCGVLGGYAAARVAGRRELFHAAVVGMADVAIGLFRVVSSGLTLPLWYLSLSFALAVPAAVLGGRLACGGPGKSNDQRSPLLRTLPPER